MQSGRCTLKNKLAAPQKVMHEVTIWSRNSSHKYTLKKNKNIYKHKNSYINVYSSIINKSQKRGKNPKVHRLWVGKNPKVHSPDEWTNKMFDVSIQWNIIQQWEEIKYRYW